MGDAFASYGSSRTFSFNNGVLTQKNGSKVEATYSYSWDTTNKVVHFAFKTRYDDGEEYKTPSAYALKDSKSLKMFGFSQDYINVVYGKGEALYWSQVYSFTYEEESDGNITLTPLFENLPNIGEGYFGNNVIFKNYVGNADAICVKLSKKSGTESVRGGIIGAKDNTLECVVVNGDGNIIGYFTVQATVTGTGNDSVVKLEVTEMDTAITERCGWKVGDVAENLEFQSYNSIEWNKSSL